MPDVGLYIPVACLFHRFIRRNGCFYSSRIVQRAVVRRGVPLLRVPCVAAAGDRGLQVAGELFGAGAGDQDAVLVNIRYFDQVAPFGGVEAHPFEVLQVEEVAVVAEESVAAEKGHQPAQFAPFDLPHGGDLLVAEFGNVEQAEDVQPLVVEDDPARDRERHQGDDGRHERGEPRREIAALVEVVESEAQGGEDGQVEDRVGQRPPADAVFIDLHRVRCRSCRGAPGR